MAAYKNQQHRVAAGTRVFHFVSYDARPANVKRGESEMGPTWFLMRAGKRWPALPEVSGQTPDEVTDALTNWLKTEGII